ncbi:MAG: hypothetical protein V3581_01295 [Candidatus Cardinium sp.]
MLSICWVSCNKHKKIDIDQNDKCAKKQMEDEASDRLASDSEPGDGHMGSNNMDTNNRAADAQGQSNTPAESMHAPTASPNQSIPPPQKLGKWASKRNCIDKRGKEVQAGEKTRLQAIKAIVIKAWKGIGSK